MSIQHPSFWPKTRNCRYYYDHKDEIDESLRGDREMVEQIRREIEGGE